MILSLFQNFEIYQLVASILLITFIMAIFVIKKFILNKVSVIDIIVILGVVVIGLLYVNILTWMVWLLVLTLVLDLIYTMYDLVKTIYVDKMLLEKTTDYLKNNEYDFFIQMSKDTHITNCSNTFLKLSKLSKKEVLKAKGWKFIFDNFDIKTLNKEEFTVASFKNFLKEYEECNSRHKMYKFTLEVSFVQDSQENEIIEYDCLIQPVYVGKKLVGRNIYFYQDKLALVERLKRIVRQSCIDLDDAYLQLDVMMSMSEGVLMYYDFQNKVYVASDCLCAYTKTTKKEYKFEELFSLIHPDDVSKYLEQAETVNSLAVTKIKYRLSIGGIYYQVEEDSIYIRKDYGLVSIIRIAERGVSQSAPQNAKIKKDLEVLEKLSDDNILTQLERTTQLLNNVLEGKKDED